MTKITGQPIWKTENRSTMLKRNFYGLECLVFRTLSIVLCYSFRRRSESNFAQSLYVVLPGLLGQCMSVTYRSDHVTQNASAIMRPRNKAKSNASHIQTHILWSQGKTFNDNTCLLHSSNRYLGVFSYAITPCDFL